MQIVHDRRMGREVPVDDRAHLHQVDVDVAIVVVVHVLPPVRQGANATSAAASATTAAERSSRRTWSTWSTRRCCRRWIRGGKLEPLIKPVHIAVAAVGIGDRGDRHVHVVADLRDDRRRLGRQAIHELHQHLRRAGLTAVQAAHQMVVRLGLGDQLANCVLACAAWIRNLGEVRAILRDVLHVRVARHPHDHEFTSFIGLANGLDTHARRRLGERAIVLQLVGVVRELLGRTGMVADNVLGCGDPGHERQVIHQRAPVLRIREPRLVVLGEPLILLLLGVSCFSRVLLGTDRGRGYGHQARGQHDATG